MSFRPILLLLLLGLPAPGRGMAADEPDAERADTTITVDRVQVTAIKQGPVLRSAAVASTILGSRAVARGGISALKEISLAVPNFHAPDYGSRMTSSIYVRGLGARIDQPVIGLNVDNVPLLNKNAFDTELADIERIEVLRGPQSTLYGRNTMGGVVNVYTLSPLTYEGVRALAEYGSGNTLRARASQVGDVTSTPKPRLANPRLSGGTTASTSPAASSTLVIRRRNSFFSSHQTRFIGSPPPRQNATGRHPPAWGRRPPPRRAGQR